jgi:membrane-associated protease RseP (regulator of RpoE activity)
MPSTFQVDLSGPIGIGINKQLKIVKVDPGSAAEAAGVAKGCTIVAIDGVKLHEFADALRAMQAARAFGQAKCAVAFAWPNEGLVDDLDGDHGSFLPTPHSGAHALDGWEPASSNNSSNIGKSNNSSKDDNKSSSGSNKSVPINPGTGGRGEEARISREARPGGSTSSGLRRLKTSAELQARGVPLAELAASAATFAAMKSAAIIYGAPAATVAALRPAPEATAGWFAKDVEASYKAALGQQVRRQK